MKDEVLKINVIDSPTGKGKTAAIINLINSEAQGGTFGVTKRFLVVTPYNTEVDRICSGTNCIEPKGRKSEDIKLLLTNGENICCTHSLLSLFTSETLDIIREGGYRYTLIIDEEISVIDNLIKPYTQRKKDQPLLESYGASDFKLLESDNAILVNKETGYINWNDEHPYNLNNGDKTGIFRDLKNRLKVVDLYKYGSGVISMVKPSLWSSFDNVSICGYRLKHSLFHYYCQLNTIQINWQHVDKGNIVNGYLLEKPFKLNKIVVYTEQLNDKCSYSKTWYTNNINYKTKELSPHAKRLRASFRKFRESFVPSDIDKKKYYWTCYKGFEGSFANKNISKRNYKPCNLRATNDFDTYQIVGYWVNRFMNVTIKNFLKDKGIILNEQELALSELIQFVWRSNIRTDDNKKVYVFISSGELTANFMHWLRE